jgi:hypothetical protein
MTIALSKGMQVAPPDGITDTTLGRIVHADATAAELTIQAIATNAATEILFIVYLSIIPPLFVERMVFIPSFVAFG